MEPNESKVSLKQEQQQPKLQSFSVDGVKVESQGDNNEMIETLLMSSAEAVKEEVISDNLTLVTVTVDPTVVKNLSCNFCAKVFCRKNHLLRHINEIHGDDQVQKHDCQICGEVFKSRGFLERHEVSHWKWKKYCPLCPNEIFGTGKDYKNHMRELHTGVILMDHKCADCERTFSSDGKLHLHRYVVHSKSYPTHLKRYNCDQCEKSYTKADNLRMHKVTHLKTTDTSCSICGKKLSTLACLKKHIKVMHLKLREYRCKDCGKAYSAQASLSSHVKVVHQKKKEFVCPICSKAFGYSPILDRHVECVHENLRPFKCKYSDCGKTFNKTFQRNRHVQSVHLKLKPHTCLECGKKFREACTLRYHIASHSKPAKEKTVKAKIKHRFTCDLCGRGYRFLYPLQNHMLMKHNMVGKQFKKEEKNYLDGITVGYDSTKTIEPTVIEQNGKRTKTEKTDWKIGKPRLPAPTADVDSLVPQSSILFGLHNAFHRYQNTSPSYDNEGVLNNKTKSETKVSEMLSMIEFASNRANLLVKSRPITSSMPIPTKQSKDKQANLQSSLEKTKVKDPSMEQFPGYALNELPLQEFPAYVPSSVKKKQSDPPEFPGYSSTSSIKQETERSAQQFPGYVSTSLKNLTSLKNPDHQQSNQTQEGLLKKEPVQIFPAAQDFTIEPKSDFKNVRKDKDNVRRYRPYEQYESLHHEKMSSKQQLNDLKERVTSRFKNDYDKSRKPVPGEQSAFPKYWPYQVGNRVEHLKKTT